MGDGEEDLPDSREARRASLVLLGELGGSISIKRLEYPRFANRFANFCHDLFHPVSPRSEII